MRERFFHIIYLFILVSSYLIIVNLVLLVVTVGGVMGLPKWLILIMVPISLIAVALLGYVLDRWGKAAQHIERQIIRRSEVWQQLFEQLDRIEGGLAGKSKYDIALKKIASQEKFISWLLKSELNVDDLSEKHLELMIRYEDECG